MNNDGPHAYQAAEKVPRHDRSRWSRLHKWTIRNSTSLEPRPPGAVSFDAGEVTGTVRMLYAWG
jgi:hypothetical protein